MLTHRKLINVKQVKHYEKMHLRLASVSYFRRSFIL